VSGRADGMGGKFTRAVVMGGGSTNICAAISPLDSVMARIAVHIPCSSLAMFPLYARK
jgi:hypothetical protein